MLSTNNQCSLEDSMKAYLPNALDGEAAYVGRVYLTFVETSSYRRGNRENVGGYAWLKVVYR